MIAAMRKRAFLLITAVLTLPLSVKGQYTDAGRVAAIELASSQARKTLEVQEKAQGMESTGMLFMSEEIKATTDFQREFNDYLDTFHKVLTYAAEIYGVYYEVTKTCRNIRELNEIISDNRETNVLALAMDSRRNTIYTEIVTNSLDIIRDIKKLCVDAPKMTEQERNKVVSAIRPKLRKFNKKLQTLTFFIHYTSFSDVVNNILGTAYKMNPYKKRDILTRCHREWLERAGCIK